MLVDDLVFIINLGCRETVSTDQSNTSEVVLAKCWVMCGVAVFLISMHEHAVMSDFRCFWDVISKIRP